MLYVVNIYLASHKCLNIKKIKVIIKSSNMRHSYGIIKILKFCKYDLFLIRVKNSTFVENHIQNTVFYRINYLCM